MKTKITLKKWSLLFFIPVFIFGVCSKEDGEFKTPNADQYVTWKISGASGNLQVPSDTLKLDYFGGATSIFGVTPPPGTTSFSISFTGAQQAGTYAARYSYVITNGKYYVPSATRIQINVTNYGSTGQYVIGNYSGHVKDSATSATMSVSGEFRIKKP